MKPALMLLITAAIMAAILVIAACAPLQQQENKTGNDTQLQTECVADSVCVIGGCSGQVCTTAGKAAGLITTCEYRAEYDCLKLTGCGCVEGRCTWRQNTEFDACLEKAKSQPLADQPQ